MNLPPVVSRITLASVAALATIPIGVARAEPTLELRVSGPSEILSGDPETSSVDATGLVGPGPLMSKLSGIAEAPITALASSQNIVYAGTAGAGLFRFDAAGAGKKVMDADKLVVSALFSGKDRVYAATNPEGKVFSLGSDGKAAPWFDPVEKYVWALLDHPKGLLVATGEPGRVLEVAAGGKSRVVFEPGETHIRALIRHPKRGVIAGGGQKGVIYQLKPGGGAFALYDSTLDEVTALAIDPRSGDLYAALVSETKPGGFIPEKSIGPVASDSQDTGAPIKGSEVVRISDNGQVDVVWTSRREGALALAYDEREKRLYVATGAGPKARGRVYAIDPGDRDRIRLAARVEPSIASALTFGAGGALLVGTAPAGQLWRIGPGTRSDSIYFSSEQDLQRPSRIGRIWFDGEVPEGAKIEVRLRSGNTKPTDETWSDWSAPITDRRGGEIEVPQGRYVQFKAVLASGSKGAAPRLKSLHASLRRKNLPPSVEEVFLLQNGVYLRPMPAEKEQEKTVTLSSSALLRLRRSSDDDDKDVRVRQGMSPGMITASWRAEDRNKDALIYRLELRRLDPPGQWQVLEDDLEHPFFSFDSTAYPDGRYQLRVTASDRPSNPPSEALSDSNTSDPITLDNTAPVIKGLTAKVTVGAIEISAEASDESSLLSEARVSINGGPWLHLPAVDGLTDARSEKLALKVRTDNGLGDPKLAPGRQTISVRVEDEAGNVGSSAISVSR